MSMRVSLDIFASLAMKEFKSLELHREEIKAVKQYYDVAIPSVIWSNKIKPSYFRIDNKANSEAANKDEDDMIPF